MIANEPHKGVAACREVLRIATLHGNEILEAGARALRTLLTWQERDRQRHALAQLDARMLKDIGLSRADVALELRKPFWHA